MTDKKYCIQLSECDGNSKDLYSFDEVEIGTWVDGKPIYRKVIAGTLAINNGNSLVFTNVSALQIGRLINLHGNMIDKDNTAQIVMPISYNRTNSLVGAVNMYYDMGTSDIKYHFLNNDGAYCGCTAYVIIEYTKK